MVTWKHGLKKSNLFIRPHETLSLSVSNVEKII